MVANIPPRQIAMSARILAAMVCCAASFSTVSLSAAISTFDNNDEGWTVTGDAQGGSVAATYHSTGGTPGGYISATDDVQGGVWYFRAPEAFHGDYLGAYGSELRFELRQSGTQSQFDSRDVYLRGGGLELLYYFRPNGYPNPGTSWTSYSIPLIETSGWRWNDGASPFPTVTEAQMRQVLANVTDLQIRGEFITGSDTGDLDNIYLVVLPGDYNHDGTVDAADYVVWRKTVGTQAGYNTWRANFGQPSGSGSVASANATVPEPTTLVLLMFVAANISWLVSPTRPRRIEKFHQLVIA